MERIKDIYTETQKQISGIEWTPDNITKLVLIVIAIAFGVSLSFKKSPVRNYFEGVRREIKQIEWLKLTDVLKYTFIVLLVSLIAVAIITPIDAGLILLKETYLFK